MSNESGFMPTGKCQCCGVHTYYRSKDNGFCPECEVEYCHYTGLNGWEVTFHHISAKHCGRYVNEFTFRLNDGNVRRHTTKRLESLIEGVAKRRLTYKRLVAR